MLKLTYAILLTDENFNETYNYITECIEKNEEKANEPTIKKAGGILAGFVLGGALGWLFPIPSLVASGAILTTKEIKRYQGSKIKRQMEKWGDYTIYSVDDLPQEFVFEEKPEAQTVYVSCNYKPNYYYPLAEFQEKLAEIKREAICDMMEGLGAKRLVVYDANKERKSIDLDVAATKKKIKGNIEYANEGGEEIEQETTFIRPSEIKDSSHPYILDRSIWKKHQERRMKNRISSDKITWTIENESCFGASVAESFSQAGFKIGGKYKSYKKKTFKLLVEYWEL